LAQALFWLTSGLQHRICLLEACSFCYWTMLARARAYPTSTAWCVVAPLVLALALPLKVGGADEVHLLQHSLTTQGHTSFHTSFKDDAERGAAELQASNATQRQSAARQEEVAGSGAVGTAKLAFVHVLTAAEQSWYWEGRSGADDMYQCVLAAGLANLRQHLRGDSPYDVVVITDKADSQMKQLMEQFGIILIVSDVLDTVDRSRDAGKIECCEHRWEWELFRPNMLKVAVFGLTRYERVVYMDFDVFLSDDVSLERGLFQNDSTQLIGLPGTSAPLAGGLLFVRPSRAAYTMMLELLQEGFSVSQGWGNRSWLVGEPNSTKAWPEVNCDKYPHYCGGRGDGWRFFAAAGDQGLIYATANSGMRSFKAVNYGTIMQEFPNVHYSGLGKPWELKYKNWTNKSSFHTFWHAWSEANATMNRTVAPKLKCASLLNDKLAGLHER